MQVDSAQLRHWPDLPPGRWHRMPVYPADPILRASAITLKPKLWLARTVSDERMDCDSPVWAWALDAIRKEESVLVRDAVIRIIMHALKVAPLEFFEERMIMERIHGHLRFDRIEGASTQDRWESVMQKRFLGFMELGRNVKHWVRPLETWRYNPDDSRRPMYQLVRHLLVRWDVPDFMDGCWLSFRAPTKELRAWYVKIGAGASPYKTNPFGMTREHTRLFMQPDEFYSMAEYFHSKYYRTKLRALGGSKQLADDLLSFVLHKRIHDPAREAFWWTVVRWFIANPGIPTKQFRLLCDYIDQRKYGRVYDRPVETGFTMKGRCPRKLLREMGRCHESYRDNSLARRETAPSGRNGFDQGEWRIQELRKAADFRPLGFVPELDAYTYMFRHFYEGKSFWSVWHVGSDGRARARLLIEMSKTGEILNVRGRRRGRHDRLPTAIERDVVARWAREQKLGLSPHGIGIYE